MNFAVVEQLLLYTPLILGAYLSLSLMRVPSLSIESAYVFGAVMASEVLLFDSSKDPLVLFVALCASAFGGALVGLVAGLLSQKAQFSHILSAIVTIGLFHGISQFLIGGTHITLSSQNNPLRLLEFFPQYPELPVVFIIAVIIAVFFNLFLKTELGLSCAIYGDNPLFLQNYRIDQSYVVMFGLACSNALAGISGYLVAQSNGFADTTMGVGLPLLCLSSLIIGKSICLPRKPIQMMIPLLGVVGYFTVQALLLKAGFDLRYFTAVQATMVAALLLFSSKVLKRSSYQDVLGV